MRAPSTAQLTKTMASTPMLHGLSAQRIAGLADEGRIRSFRRGTYLCHQADDSDDVYFLVAGRIEVSTISPAGTRVLHASVDRPQFLGELAVFGQIPRTADLLALEDSDVWMIDGERFVRFVTANPTAARQVLAALARQVRSSQAFVDDLLFLDLRGRVAKRLLQMGTPSLDDLPPDGTVIPPVTHADLASLCGGSRENVSRILSDLQRRGVIKREGHRYTLRKVASLAKMADL